MSFEIRENHGAGFGRLSSGFIVSKRGRRRRMKKDGNISPKKVDSLNFFAKVAPLCVRYQRIFWWFVQDKLKIYEGMKGPFLNEVKEERNFVLYMSLDFIDAQAARDLPPM
jgi:hypothetical protein